MKKHDLIGKRIRLLSMPLDPSPIQKGATGTVRAVGGFGDWEQIHVNWDNGRTLMLVVPPDRYEVIHDET